MDNTFDFSALEKKASLKGSGSINDIDASTKEFTIFNGSFFLIGDIFQFPPTEQIRCYLQDYHGNDSPVANIAKNSKLDWRPVKAFCRVCSKDSAKFLADAETSAKTLGLVACNRDFVESGDVPQLLRNFAGKTVKVVARVSAYKGTKFVKGVGATEHAPVTLPVFVIV